jgi:hypothetical protein
VVVAEEAVAKAAQALLVAAEPVVMEMVMV